MNEIIKRIDEEINRLWEKMDGMGSDGTPYVVVGLKKAKEIIEKDFCTKCTEDYQLLSKDFSDVCEESDRLEYQKRLSAIQTQKYIEIVDSLMEKNEKLSKKKTKKSESISRTPDQIQELADGFIQLADRLKETKKELQEVKYQCKDWELEAKKSAAKLGEIRILMDGEADK